MHKRPAVSPQEDFRGESFMKGFSLRPEHQQRLLEIKAAKGHVVDAAPVPAPSPPDTSPADDKTSLEQLQRATSFEALFGLELGDYWDHVVLFMLVARAYSHKATSYGDIARMLRSPSSPLLTDELVGQIVQETLLRHIALADETGQRQIVLPSRIALWRAVAKLEGFFQVSLVCSSGEGLGCNALTRAGEQLAKLIEPFLRKCCKL